MAVTRFGVSLDSELLEALDSFVQANNFPNRSQAIGYLTERNLVENKWRCNHIVAGAIILIWNFNKHDLKTKIANILNKNSTVILSSQSFYLSEEKTMEIIAVKGTANNLTELSDKLISIKGIEHGKLTMSKAE